MLSGALGLTKVWLGLEKGHDITKNRVTHDIVKTPKYARLATKMVRRGVGNPSLGPSGAKGGGIDPMEGIEDIGLGCWWVL